MNNFFSVFKCTCKRITIITGIILGSLMILLGVLLTAAYFLTPQLTRYDAQLAEKLSELVERPVTIGKVEAYWEGLGPTVQLNNVEVWDRANNAIIISAKDIEVKVSILDLLLKQKLVPKEVAFDNVHMSLVQTTDEKFEIKGFDNLKTSKSLDIYSLLEKIIEFHLIEINNAKIDVHLANGETSILQDFNAVLVHHFYQVRLEGFTTLYDQTNQGEVALLLTFDPRALSNKKWNADLKLIAKEMEIPKWLKFWPSAPIQVESAQGDIKVDMSWEENLLMNVQTSLLLKQLAILYANKELPEQTNRIELDSISADMDAQLNKAGWLVNGDINGQPITGGEVNVYTNLLLPEKLEEAQIELSVAGKNLPAVPTLNTYLVKGLLHEKLEAWLKKAIQGGNIEEIDMLVRGPLNKIPFENKEGIFEIIVDFNNLDLHFNKEWQPLQQVHGHLILRNKEFVSIINQGKIGGGDIEEAVVVIQDINQADILINMTGKVDGTAESTIAFLQKSPLWPQLKVQLEPLDIKGPVQISLDMDIPLIESGTKSKIFGAVDFSHASVTFPAQDLTFSDVNGQVLFDEHGVYADKLTALFYGQAVTAQLASQTGKNGFLAASLQGNIDISHLKKRHPNPLWTNWSGIFPFSANLEWRHPDDPNPSRLVATSNLQGIDIKLPQPFSKPANQQLEFSYQAEFAKTENRQKINYGDLLFADLYFSKKNNTSELSRGLVRIQGSTTTMEVPKQGLLIAGYLPTIDINEWVPIIQGAGGQSSSYTLSQVDVRLKLDTLKALGQNLAVNTLNAERLGQQWQTNISGKDMQGEVLIPHDLKQNPIAIKLNYLDWATKEDNQPKKDVPPPADLPNFTVNIKHFVLNDKDRGNLKLATKMGNKSMSISPLRLEHPDYILAATSRWSWANSPSTTALDGTITAQNLGGLLKIWGISEGMLGGKGVSKLDFNWQGGPDAFDIDDIKGKLIVDWRNGRLVEVKPGMGRILSLFSIPSLTRRLRLDFSDIFKQGFTFDRVTSDMTFNEGVINTKNGQVTSTAGKIIFNGNAYTITKSLDLNLQVIPALPTPIAAGVAIVNPILGVAKKATGQSSTSNKKGLLSTYYHVIGPWEEPIITEQ